MDKEKICCICYNNNNIINLKCCECLQSLCIECCNNLDTRKTILIDNKIINIKYNCPFCRKENLKNIKNFNKNEVEDFYLNNLKCYINSYNLNKKYENNILILNNNNDNLKNVIKEKNEEIEKQNEIIKKIIRINKNNMIHYNILLDYYKNIFKY